MATIKGHRQEEGGMTARMNVHIEVQGTPNESVNVFANFEGSR